MGMDEDGLPIGCPNRIDDVAKSTIEDAWVGLKCRAT